MRHKQIALLVLLGLSFVTAGRAQSHTVAVVGTTAFTHRVGGIARLLRAQQAAEAEFDRDKDELNRLRARIDRLKSEFIPIPVYPADGERRPADVERLEKEMERKLAEFSARYNRRMGEALGPVRAEVRKRLEEFAQREGIALLLDKSRTACATGAPCRWEAAGVRDITEDFIREHNRLYP